MNQEAWWEKPEFQLRSINFLITNGLQMPHTSTERRASLSNSYSLLLHICLGFLVTPAWYAFSDSYNITLKTLEFKKEYLESMIQA